MYQTLWKYCEGVSCGFPYKYQHGRRAGIPVEDGMFLKRLEQVGIEGLLQVEAEVR